MGGPVFWSHRRGEVVAGDDGVDQVVQYNLIICLTAGNFIFRLVDPSSGAETGDITLAMTAGMQLPVTPKKIMATGLTGTYLGLITA